MNSFNLDSGEIAATVAVVGMFLNYLGITGIDSGVITGAINGFIAVITLGAAVWSVYSHRAKNIAAVA